MVRLYILAVLALTVLGAYDARAQADFLIPVNAPSGMAISGATVSLTCAVPTSGCGSNTYSFNSDSAGNARPINVVVGRYTVLVTGPGILPYAYLLDVNSPNPGSSSTATVALKPTTSDAIQYVSPNGNDANDGLSVGTAKLTVAAACAALPGGNSSCSAGSGSIFITPAFAGTVPSPAAPGVIIFQQKASWQMKSLGTFTTGATYDNLQVLVNGCNPTTELQATFTHPGLYATEGISSCVSNPSSSTQNIVSALSAYVANSETGCCGISLYSQSRCLVNGSSCWGAQLVAQDAVATTGTSLYGLEVDVNDMNTSGGTTNLFGINVFGNFPSASFAIGYALNPPSGGGTWGSGFRSLAGATTNGDAFVADLLTATSSSISQSLAFISKNVGTTHTASIFSSAFGDVTVSPDVARSLVDLGGFQEPLSTKTSAYTLTMTDSWINVTGTTTITVPHTLTGQRWDVFNSGVGTVTIQPDSGTINGAASVTRATNTGYSITCDGTNCFAH
jgi:hypothetical protein